MTTALELYRAGMAINLIRLVTGLSQPALGRVLQHEILVENLVKNQRAAGAK